MANNRMSPLGLGLSLGVIWGLSIFLMGLAAYYYAYGYAFVTALGSIYIGYAPSFMGSVWGGIIGFVDAFITGFLIAWLYNKFQGYCNCGKKTR